MQVPAACFVGRSCHLSRKETLLIWERKLRQQSGSAVPSGEAGIVVQLQLWESESGRKACSVGLRRGLSQLVCWQLPSCDVPDLPASSFRRQGCAGKGDVHAALRHGKPNLLKTNLSESWPLCLQSSLPARPGYKITSCTLGGRSRAN